MPDDPQLPPAEGRQPWLHDLVPTIQAPVQVWSATSGQVSGRGVTGYIHADVRVLRRAVVRVAGVEPVPMAHHAPSADHVVFSGLVGGLGDPGVDPTVRVVRQRRVSAVAVTEVVEVHSWAHHEVPTSVEVEVASDLARLDVVKRGIAVDDVRPAVTAGGLSWSGEGTLVELVAPGAQVTVEDMVARLTWEVEVPPGGSVRVGWTVTDARLSPRLSAPSGARASTTLRASGDDRRWGPVLARSLSDVDGLRMSLVGTTDQDFAAAGAPWFLTLFGRDSLWTARMALPAGTGLAGSTLRALAAFQGVRHDPVTGEAPGKIIHEVRAEAFTLAPEAGDSGTRTLPPVYYGAIDSTPLWVLTLHDAWRWGLPEAEVRALLPALEGALGWVTEHGDVDGDGFLEYVDESGTGLSNQGWKDSGDAVRQADGSLARAPIALCEVQAYAYAAAVGGAELLDAFGRPGAPALREWAARLREAFRAAFWVRDDEGPFPAIALDADKRPVASLTSNIGHLLGTGLLDDEESALVARRLGAPDMSSGFGLRTLSSRARGYSPTGYHVGSVWPHDTAIAVAGLASVRAPEALALADGLLEAMQLSAGRAPELFAGDDRTEQPVPLPYPAACRPQAWAAAAAVSLLSSVLGLRPGGDGGLVAEPLQPWPFGALSVDGVRVAGASYRVDVAADGTARVTPGT